VTKRLAGSISRLVEMVESLEPEERERFARIFRVDASVGELIAPATMHSWIEKQFGSLTAVQKQNIVKVTNLITLEGALFNELRASRPMEARVAADLDQAILSNVGDPFCKPLEGTPEDVFGRVRGKYSMTASNVAKYDGFHGVVIFDEHHPLHFTAAGVKDYFDTALRWMNAAHSQDKEARYFFMLWNCLWKSGASILHGHAQMTLSRGIHYARIENQRRAALLYKVGHGSDYFDELFAVHKSLGLGFEKRGVRVLAYLTPIKEKEVLLLAPALDDRLKDASYRVLRCLVDQLGVSSFNLALWLRPIDSVDEDWSGFPAVVRIVDRGDPNNRTSDIGAMELYANSVIASDPFRLAEVLQSSLIHADGTAHFR
jgi:hypothetical protein